MGRAPEPERAKGHHRKGLGKENPSSTGAVIKDTQRQRGDAHRPIWASGQLSLSQSASGKASEGWTHSARLRRLHGSGWDPCQGSRRGDGFDSSTKGARSCRAAASTASPVARERSQALAKRMAGSGSPAPSAASAHRAPWHPRRDTPVQPNGPWEGQRGEMSELLLLFNGKQMIV